MQDIRTHFGVTGGEAYVQRTQDCTPIAEETQALHREGFHGSSNVKHAARIPNILIEKYCQDNGITFREWLLDEAHIRRMLNDPALAHFRIWPGQI
jgi:hypothetical protein